MSREIAAEITTQLKALKKQLNREIVEDLTEMKRQIMEEVAQMIDERLGGLRGAVNDELRKQMPEIKKQLDDRDQQITLAQSQQLELVRKDVNGLVAAVGRQLQTNVYNKVMGEINEKVVKKMNNVLQMVEYNSQDHNEMITDYRRAMDKNTNDDNQNIRLFFNDN